MSFRYFYGRTWNIAAAAILAFILVQPPVALAESLYTVELKMKDGRFSPEALEVPAGQKIKIVLILGLGVGAYARAGQGPGSPPLSRPSG